MGCKNKELFDIWRGFNTFLFDEPASFFVPITKKKTIRKLPFLIFSKK